MNRAWGLGLLALASLSGCAARDPSEGGAEERTAIIDGELSGANEDGVVLLRAVPPDVAELVCSASLVAPNLLVTARHCVSYFQDGYFNCSPSGELVDSVDGAGHLGLHFEPSSIEVYGNELPRKKPLAHGSQIISTLSDTICLNDLAFVVLDTALDLPIVPLRLGRPARVDESVVLVGYGLDADQSKLDYQTQPRRHKTGLNIADVGPDSLADGVVRAPPRTVILQGPSGCIGDSGGPLLDADSGALLGVYSLQQGESCSKPTIRHFLVHVPPFELLIEQAFAAAGAEPVREPAPAQGGAAGAAGEANGGGGESSLAGGAAGADHQQSGADHATQDSGCALGRSPEQPWELALELCALATAVERIRSRSRRGRRSLRDGRRWRR
jgi:hypothetical protein